METTLNKTKDGENLLIIKARHYNGRYYVSVHKEVKDGLWSTWKPFEEGNYNFTIMNGRKSQKRLEKMNNIIDNLGEELKDMWKYGQYKTLMNTVLIEMEKNGFKQ